MRTFNVTEIGVARTPLLHRRDAPCQPAVQGGVVGRVELHADFAPGLADLAGFGRVWLLYIFDRNTGYRLRVQPPRGPRRKRGLFATRSPHRPSPLGLTSARLLGVEGHILHLADLDLLDGTPVVDVKPYLPEVDAFPDAAPGWLGELARPRPEPAPRG